MALPFLLTVFQKLNNIRFMNDTPQNTESQNVNLIYQLVWALLICSLWISDFFVELFEVRYLKLLIMLILVNLIYIFSFKVIPQVHEKFGSKLKSFLLVNVATISLFTLSKLAGKLLTPIIVSISSIFPSETNFIFLLLFFFLFCGVVFYYVVKPAKK